MALDLSLVGQPLPETTHSYDWKDCVLYALGVGMGTDDLDYVWEAHPDFKVLPSFAVVPTLAPCFTALAAAGADLRTVVHGAQTIKLHAPLPKAATLRTAARISEIQDKGKGAVVIFDTETFDGDTLLFETSWSVFCRGQGGFGGERGARVALPKALEGAAPLAEITVQSRADQALLYRLSGDTNPLHINPDLATKVGFEAPILHGLCTYGFAVREAVAQLMGGDPSRLQRFSARFSQVVYPGDALVLKYLPTDATGVVVFEAWVGERKVLDSGVIEFR
jgi:acyl dehydratase